MDHNVHAGVADNELVTCTSAPVVGASSKVNLLLPRDKPGQLFNSTDSRSSKYHAWTERHSFDSKRPSVPFVKENVHNRPMIPQRNYMGGIPSGQRPIMDRHTQSRSTINLKEVRMI